MLLRGLIFSNWLKGFTKKGHVETVQNDGVKVLVGALHPLRLSAVDGPRTALGVGA